MHDDIVEDALMAFWSKIADRCPHIMSGDMPPEVEFRFKEAAREAVKVWIHYNLPEGGEQDV